MKSKKSYKTLLHQWQSDIASGVLSPGERMPSERDLARKLGVHRSTVARALNALVDQGLVERRIGSGTFISDNKWGIEVPDKIDWHTQLNSYPEKDWYEQLINNALKKTPTASWKRLDYGDAPTSWLPEGRSTTVSWESLFAEAAENDRLGLYKLRKTVAEYLDRHYQLSVDPREILITSGTRQALFLVTHGYLQPGDTVAVEAPSYFYSLRLFQAAGLILEPIPLDSQGLSLNHLADVVKRKPIRMLFINPVFQNPTGIATTRKRKQEVIDFCSRHHIPIFEDDASSRLPYICDTDCRPMKAFDPFQQILYAGSISKYMGPSIRLGWLIGPARLMEALAELRQDMDAGLSILPQLMVQDYLNDKLEQQISRLNKQLRQKLNETLDFMTSRYPDLSPLALQGGFYLYYRFDGMGERFFRHRLVELLNDHIIVQSGRYFGEQQLAMRLNISHF